MNGMDLEVRGDSLVYAAKYRRENDVPALVRTYRSGEIIRFEEDECCEVVIFRWDGMEPADNKPVIKKEK